MPDGIPSRLAAATRERGAAAVARKCVGWGARYAAGRVARTRSPAFEFDGQRVTPFHHPHQYTWMNERGAELALAFGLLGGTVPEQVLEVGNVLGHYRPPAHTVVDLYERAPGVINQDVVDYDGAGRKFDLILSVSTLEHVGFDELPRDPDKVIAAVERLRSLLVPGGLLWATLPVGYNAVLDDHVRAGRLGFDSVRALRRRGERWSQVELEQAWDAPFDRLLFEARGLLVCELNG